MNTDLIPTIIGFTLFAISEILPLINIPTNGILQTFFLGFKRAFSSPEKNIELAEVLIHSKPELGLANIVNTIGSNPVVQNIMSDLMNNPSNINNITAVQKNKEIATVVSILRNNSTIKDMVTNLLSDPVIYNNINVLLSNPVVSSNSTLISALANPDIANNIQQLLHNPQLSSIITTLGNDPNKLANINSIMHNIQSQQPSQE